MILSNTRIVMIIGIYYNLSNFTAIMAHFQKNNAIMADCITFNMTAAKRCFANSLFSRYLHNFLLSYT
jgi:hypothetical protein